MNCKNNNLISINKVIEMTIKGSLSFVENKPS